MKLHQLPKTITKSKKRVGRGYGSGVGGHTSTRGQKGQQARSKVKIWFEGGQLPLTKKLPFLRGKDRFKAVNASAAIVNLDQLKNLEPNTEVTKEVLVKMGLVTLKEVSTQSIKVLARGELSIPLTFKGVLLSEAAAKKIEAAGGSIVR